MYTEISKTNSKALFFYYGILLIIMSSWTDLASSPSVIIRIVFFLGIILPLFQRTWLTPIVLSLFLIVSDNSFAESVLPKGTLLYIIALLALLLVSKNDKKNTPLYITIILLIYVFLVNVINNINSSGATTLTSAPLYKSLFFLFIFSFLARRGEKNYYHVFSYSFIAASFMLSLLLLLCGEQFRTDVGEFESFIWMDANYWSNVIGMGVLASFFELYYKRESNVVLRPFLITVIVLGIGVIIFVSSRGALLSLSAALIVLLLLSNIKTRYKVISSIGIITIVYLLYRWSFMDQLLFRLFEEDTFGTGSGRTDIWKYKLGLFFHSDIIHVIFGFGRDNGTALGANGTIAGYSGYMSTHNDFVSFIIYYGIVGFSLFIRLLTVPFRNKNNREVVLCGFVFICVSVFTIEPFATGNFAWFAFLFYLYMWSQSPEAIISKQKT